MFYHKLKQRHAPFQQIVLAKRAKKKQEEGENDEEILVHINNNVIFLILPSLNTLGTLKYISSYSLFTSGHTNKTITD